MKKQNDLLFLIRLFFLGVVATWSIALIIGYYSPHAKNVRDLSDIISTTYVK